MYLLYIAHFENHLSSSPIYILFCLKKILYTGYTESLDVCG